MMASCNTNDIVEYDRRRSGLLNEPLDMEYDNNKTEIKPNIASQSSVKQDNHVRVFTSCKCDWAAGYCVWYTHTPGAIVTTGTTTVV